MARPLLPLNAPPALESPARHLNFTRAGDELSVTPGAVSQQIRLLADGVGDPLFRREARDLEITDLAFVARLKRQAIDHDNNMDAL